MANKTVGIICEYNPFHYGHKYHIEMAKKVAGADSAVCIMSGSMVQRGEPAIFDKWGRAKQAISGGADLVIELPSYYVLQSSDNFAFGAIKILDELSIVDAICFGSETDDINLLKKASEKIQTKEYSDALKERLSKGFSYPSSSEYALLEVLGEADENLFLPNSTLGISYISAIRSLKSSIKPYCIKRDNDYHSFESEDEFLSAHALRFMIKNGADYSKYAPSYQGLPTHSLEMAESYILGFFRNAKKEDLENIKGYEEGLFSLVQKSAKMCFDVNEFFASCVSKRYTLSRIKRFCMCALLGISGDLEPDYVRVLGFNKRGRGLIKEIKKKSPLTVVTKTADYKGSDMFEIDIRATDFASLCSSDKDKRLCSKDFTTPPYIEK